MKLEIELFNLKYIAMHCIIILTLALDVFVHDHCDCRWWRMRHHSACTGTVSLRYAF